MKNKMKLLTKILITLLIFFSVLLGINIINQKRVNENAWKENVISHSYKKLMSGDEDIERTDYVKFSAFFLRDLDNDGVAEKIYGTVNELGKEDNLYFEINVLTDGVLKDGKIEIDGKNFYLATSLPKDSILKSELFDNNTKLIEFNDINNGTQKLIKAFVRSGNYTSSSKTTDAIGNNKNNYSRKDNNIHFSGRYCPSNGDCIDIDKDITLEVDWYGDIYTKINTTEITNNNQNNNIASIVKDDKVEISFPFITEETRKELILKSNHSEVTIPKFNGYDALSAIVTNTNVNYEYKNGKLIIDRTATELEDEISAIPSTNTYQIVVTYPLNAYTDFYNDETESIELVFPISEYYEGYNNDKDPFVNPLRSNVATDSVKVKYLKYKESTGGVFTDNASVKVGKLMYYPYQRYAVSKSKPIRIYNGYSSSEFNDDYEVLWTYFRGNTGNTSNVILKENKTNDSTVYDNFIKSDSSTESMKNITHYKGFYLNDLEDKIEEDGYVNIYNDDTNELIVSIPQSKLSNYNSNTKVKYYQNLVDHVRVEIYGLKENSSISIHHIKEIDDDVLTDKYDVDEFSNLDYISTTLEVYNNETNTLTLNHEAHYEVPYSEARISIERKAFSSFDTVNTNISIDSSNYSEGNVTGWKNATYLIKLPDEFLKTEIKDVTVDNKKVEILSYEYYENDLGKFIKIYTKNEQVESYNILINTDITIIPKINSSKKEIELYAENEEGTLYYNKKEDIYDLNSNNLTTDIMNYSKTEISITAPNTLITTEAVVDYDDSIDNEITIGPNVAMLDKTKENAIITLTVQNNYSESVSDICIQGKIPYTGNTSILTGVDLKSSFNSTLMSGLTIPDEIKDKVKIYLSEEENPTNDINDLSNNWILESDVTDFSKIKSYIIDLSKITMNTGDSYDFSYRISLPKSVEYNEKSYSTHAIYFSIDTENGKYITSTEPAKVGVQIVKKYTINFSKYHKNSIKLLPGATYSVSEIIENDDGSESIGITKTGVSGEDGTFEISDLLINKIYEISEIKSPENYALNSEPIRIYASVNDNEEVVVNVISGELRDEIVIEKDGTTNTNVMLNIDDEVLGKLSILKIDSNTGLPLKNIKFKITGDNYTYGKVYTTNSDGVIIINNLMIDSEYTLEETKANGYFINEPIKFMIKNNNGEYVLKINSGLVKNSSVSVGSDGIPNVNLEITNEKIPIYNLNVYKIKNTTDLELQDEESPITQEKEYIKGAMFELYQGNKKIGEYTTGENGLISLTNLFAYTDGVNTETTYTLKEIKTPSGYSKVKDITFRVDSVNGKLKFNEFLTDGQSAKDYKVEGDTITLEVKDNPIFVITKKDSETEEVIANVKFAIYNVDNGETPAVDSEGNIIGTKEIINGKEYYVVTTDSNGQISVDLPEGLYKLIEVDAGDKYQINDKEYYFGIGVDQNSNDTYITNNSSKLVGGSNSDSVEGSFKTKDDGYIVYGTTTSNTVNVDDETIFIKDSSDSYYYLYIMKFNSKNELQWINKDVRTRTSADNINLVEAKDGSLLLSFRMGLNTKSYPVIIGDETYSESGYPSMLVKFTESGELDWYKALLSPTNSDSYASLNIMSSTALENGNILLGGSLRGSIRLGTLNVTSNYRCVSGIIIEVEPDGTFVSADKYDPTSTISSGYTTNLINYVKKSKDGGYYAVLSYTTTYKINGVSYTQSNKDKLLIKFNSSHEVESVIQIKGQPTYIRDIEEVEDGLLVSVTTDSSITIGNQTISHTTSGGYDAIVLKFNNSNELEWNVIYGARTNFDEIYDIYVMDDGNYAVSGVYNNYAFFSTISPDGQKGSIYTVVSNGKAITIIDYDETNKKIIGSTTISNITVEDKKIFSNGSTDILIYIEDEKQNIDINFDNSKRDSSDNTVKYNSVIDTMDGGYVVGGYTSSKEYSIQDYTLTKETDVVAGLIEKFDSDNNIEWVTPLYGSNIYISKVVETESGEYLASGYYTDNTNDVKEGDYILESHGKTDCLIIKLDSQGKVLWIKTFGGEEDDYSYGITSTEDGGYVVVGGFYSSELVISETTLSNPDTSKKAGYVIKFNSVNEVEWNDVKNYSENYYNASFDDVTELNDGRIAIAGTRLRSYQAAEGFVYSQEGEQLSNYYISSSSSSVAEFYNIGSTDDGGFVVSGYISSCRSTCSRPIYGKTNNIYELAGTAGIAVIGKFDENGDAEKYGIITADSSSNNYAYSIKQTLDDGYILAGSMGKGTIKFEVNSVSKSSNRFENDITINLEKYHLTNNTNDAGYIIKLNNDFTPEWGSLVNGSSTDKLYDIAQLQDGTYVAVGDTNSSKITLNDTELVNVDDDYSNDGLILRLSPKYNVEEKVSLDIVNDLKKYKITTEVIPTDGVKGGTISGEGLSPYEVVKHGKDSQNEIKIVPKSDYEIMSIYINDEQMMFVPEDDGSFTLPIFDNMTEDKHVKVQFAIKERKISITKKDSYTNETIKEENVEFNIQQMDDRDEPDQTQIGDLVDNSAEFVIKVKDDDVMNLMPNIVNNGTYTFVNDDGKLIPTNSKYYRIKNGGTSGVNNSYAYSYIEIDLTDMEGEYIVSLDANISSESGDVGFAAITDDTTAPLYYSSTGRFIYASGEPYHEEYLSDVITGGNKYYLHIGYYKDGSIDKNDDVFMVNSIKLCTFHEETKTFNFIDNNGVYESTNQGYNNTTSNSYIPIDLTELEGEYYIVVNAEISSEASDYGYANISTTTDRIVYTNSTNRVFRISGETTAKDYKLKITGGQLYYLHLGYYKNIWNNYYDDILKINDIKIELYSPDLYSTTALTNSDGIAYAQLPYGRYKITEVKEPNGYYLSSEEKVIQFRDSTPHEIEFNDDKKTEVIVHHLLKDSDGNYTETKLYDDEVMYGKVGDDYMTSPQTIPMYNLEKVNEEYVFPNNKDGKHTYDTIEVTYYYEKGEIPLIVKHLIEGTTTPVTLKDGSKAETYETAGRTGDTYTTNPINEDELDDKYELSIVPTNATGTYGEDEIEVIYYYKPVERNISIIKTDLSGNNVLKDVKFEIDGKEYITDSNGKINIKLGYGRHTYKEIETLPEYQLDSEEKVIDVTKDIIDNYEIKVTNDLKKGRLIVHHYIEDTTDSVPLLNGNLAEDVITEDYIGKLYVTNPLDNSKTNYELVNREVDNYQGIYKDGVIEVTYYYRVSSNKYMVEYYYNDIKDNSLTDTIDSDIGSIITTYTDKVKDGYKLKETKNLPLTVTDNLEDNIIKIYYVSEYKIITDVIEHEEKYSDGTVRTVKGGTISGEDLDSYELVEYKNDSTKNIIITPDEGYEISKVLINGTPLDIESFVDDTGKITLNKDNNYFKNVTENKKVEVEFKKKSKVIIKYLEVGTEKVLSSDTVLEGYQDEEFTTERKNISDYREGLITLTNGNNGSVSYQNKNPFNESDKHVFTADEQTIIYWYEKIPNSTVIVKHIEVDALGNETILEEENYTDRININVVTSRKEYVDETTGRDYESIENGVCEVCIDKNTNTYTATITENKVIEVKYFYNRNYIITTKNNTPDGGTISGEGLDSYEKVIRNGSNEKEIVITPNSGYKVKEIKVNGNIIDTTALEENKIVTIPSAYFSEVKEDKLIEVEFEKIPAKVIVKYIDIDTNEEIIEEKEINGFVNDPYNEERVNIEGYTNAGTEPVSSGNMVEDVTEIVYYYKKQYKITTDVIEHLEKVRDYIEIPGVNNNERQITVKGGTISGEDETPYESVLKGNNSTKDIVIKADDGYKISFIKINGTEIDITNEKEMILNKFISLNEDKHIEVKFEKIGIKLVVEYIDKETGKILYSDIDVGNLNDEYITHEKIIDGYEYIGSTNNTNGILEEDTTVIYYYQRIKTPTIVDKIINEIILNNPKTGDSISFTLITLMTSLIISILRVRKKSKNL